MKAWILVVAVCGGITALIAFWEIEHRVERRVIHIKGGDPVIADRVSQSDEFVLFTIGDTSGMFMNNDVASVAPIQVIEKTRLLTIIDHKKSAIMSALGFNQQLVRAADARLLIFLMLLATAAAGVKLSRLMINARANQRLGDRSADEVLPLGFNSVPAVSPRAAETSDLRDIAMFFLELFKLQQGLAKDAPARFSMTPETVRRRMKVFELGVKGSGDWQTRRISIGPLGADAGSKSKCYYVIYDTPMVVKIPPMPITDISRYVKEIRRDVQIAAQLAPITCIVPMVSVVLKKVTALPYASSLTRDQLEKQYIRLIEQKTEYRQYLKIGDRFAFFMELTHSFFLERVIDELHRSKHHIAAELHEAPDMLWSQEAFTARYGLDALPVFEGLQGLYRSCEETVEAILRESVGPGTIHPFQIKHWFLAAIAGEALNPEQTGLDEVLLQRIEAALSTLCRSHRRNVDDLIRILKARSENQTFMKSRRAIESIGTSVLQLLCRLKEKEVALRDLKPDNLFVDADPNRIPAVLNDLAAFSMGVIDLETAVSLIPLPDGTVAQPLLGGTPLYATPLHLLKNTTLSAYFGSVPEVLHLQDWFAAIAILFKSMTGRNLFQRAARSFPDVLKTLKPGHFRSGPGEAAVAAASRQFWTAAAADIHSRLSAYGNRLNRLIVVVPDALVPLIGAELEREKRRLTAAIRRHVDHCPLVKSEANRTFLLEASNDTLARQIMRWQNHAQMTDHQRRLAPRMVAVLKHLQRLKQEYTEKERAAAALAQAPYALCADALIAAMFQMVYHAFYPSRWRAPAGRTESVPQPPAMAQNQDLVATPLSRP